MDVVIIADLFILLLVLTLPLASQRVEQNLKAFLFIMGILSALAAGGMLILGNIPNVIAAHKLRIPGRTWARYGVPLGLGLLVGYFVILFVV